MTGGTRVRLSPEARRGQLLDLGVRLLATRSLDELSIDDLAEEAGVSRGLLYHYFGGKQDFHEAVVRRAADDLVAQTAPPLEGDARQRLHTSVEAYLAYVEANQAGYRSLVKAASSGNEVLRGIYDEARAALTDRIFTSAAQADLIPDTPAVRLLARGWAAMAEEMVLAWTSAPGAVSRAELVDLMTDALPALVLVAVAPDPPAPPSA